MQERKQAKISLIHTMSTTSAFLALYPPISFTYEKKKKKKNQQRMCSLLAQRRIPEVPAMYCSALYNTGTKSCIKVLTYVFFMERAHQNFPCRTIKEHYSRPNESTIKHFNSFSINTVPC